MEASKRNWLEWLFPSEHVRCEDAATGAPIDWPAELLPLRGSFDRVPLP